MSEPTSNQDWPAWIVAICTVIPLVAIPFIWLSCVAGNARSIADEWKEYLEQRDELSESRHLENLANFKELFKSTSTTGERVARLEGVITGNHRQL